MKKDSEMHYNNRQIIVEKGIIIIDHQYPRRHFNIA